MAKSIIGATKNETHSHGRIRAAVERHRNLPDWITAICTAVIMFTGLGALWYARGQITEAHDEAQVDRLLREEEKFEQEPLVSYRELYAQQRLKGIADPDAEYQVLDFLETMGELVNHGSLDENEVWNSFDDDIEAMYADMHVMIEQENDPHYYDQFLYLARRMFEIDRANHEDDSLYTKGELQGYWQDELVVIAGVPTIHRKGRTAK
jgi:hypothetical protein